MTPQTIVPLLIAAGMTSITIADVCAPAVVLKEEQAAAAKERDAWKDASLDQLLGLVPVAAAPVKDEGR